MRLIFLALAAAPAIAFAAPIKYSTTGGGVEALAIGKPTFIKIRGKGEPAKGELSVDGRKVTGKFEFPLASLDTGIDLRNEHMRDKYLEVKKHPVAKLEIKTLELKDEFVAGKSTIASAPFEGELTMHGVTKPVKGKFAVDGGREVNADFRIKLSDFAVEIPKYLGVTVADEVDVQVKIDELMVESP